MISAPRVGTWSEISRTYLCAVSHPLQCTPLALFADSTSVVISSKSFTLCEELREPAAPGVLAASLVARFPSGALTGASGSGAGSGFRASWARRVPATSEAR